MTSNGLYADLSSGARTRKEKSCTGQSPSPRLSRERWGSAIAAPAAKPTDPQIAHIAYTAGQLDIEAAKQALDKSKNQEVRAFAQRMVGDHTSVNDQALALVKKLNVTPEDNPTSQSLTQAADAERKKLAGLDGAAFDKAYVDNEAAYHKTVNEAFSKTLIPDAQKCAAEIAAGKGPEIVRRPSAACRDFGEAAALTKWERPPWTKSRWITSI